MGKLQTLKDRILNSAIDIAFRDFVNLRKKGKIPKSVYLEGLDVTSLTKMVVGLGSKFRRHNIDFFTQEVNGAELFDARAWYLKGLANIWAREIYPSFPDMEGEYVVIKGGESKDREEVMGELVSIMSIPVYTDEQYPSNPRKIILDLSEFNHSVVS